MHNMMFQKNWFVKDEFDEQLIVKTAIKKSAALSPLTKCARFTVLFTLTGVSESHFIDVKKVISLHKTIPGRECF